MPKKNKKTKNSKLLIIRVVGLIAIIVLVVNSYFLISNLIDKPHSTTRLCEGPSRGYSADGGIIIMEADLSCAVDDYRVLKVWNEANIKYTAMIVLASIVLAVDTLAWYKFRKRI